VTVMTTAVEAVAWSRWLRRRVVSTAVPEGTSDDDSGGGGREGDGMVSMMEEELMIFG
jgi:hypothetical protein